MIKVTVIIPVYQVEDYLEDCLDSVISQTLKDMDVICVDDASEDRCPEILDRYAGEDDRISVIHLTENMGQGNGRNLGLHQARGKYVYFLDSDDMITPEAMEELYEDAEKNQLDGIFFDSQVIYDEGVPGDRYASYPAVRHGDYPNGTVTGRELFDRMIAQGEWTSYPQRQFWNRGYLQREEIDYPVRVEHEDEVFSFKASLAADRVVYRNAQYFIRRYRPDSVMTSPPAPKNFYGYFMDLCYMDRFARERGISGTAIDRNLARVYEKVERYYRDLSADHDLESWFKTEEERHLFWFFETAQKGWMHYGMLSGNVLQKASESKEIYIYGAGVYARQVAKSLAMRGYVIKAFMVTDKTGNPDALEGHPVLAFDSFRGVPDTSIVIIAVTDGYRAQIEKNLSEAGWNHVYYKE